MNPTEIGKAYDQIAHVWASDEFNRQNGMQQHRKAISFTQNRGRALDIGCGCSGRFIDLLVSEGFEPEGVDISEEMVRLARTRNPGITFHHQNICDWDLPQTYDFITAWDSIWHIPLEQQENVLTKIVAGLNSGGVFIFSFGGVGEPGAHRTDVMGPEVYYSSLGASGFLQLFMKLGCICRHLEYDQYPELHAYLVVQKPGTPT